MTGNPQTGVRRDGGAGVHSLDHFSLGVPSIDEAERFFAAFGLDVRRAGDALELRTFDSAHCWGVVNGTGRPKRLQYLSFGVHAGDLPVFAARVARAGIGCAPHPLGDGQGLWLRSPDGVPLQLKIADKVTPDVAPEPARRPPPARGGAAAPARSQVRPVRPRRLSHVLCFTPDVPRMVEFCRAVLGMRLSDHSADAIAFLHAVHGSDHHLLAFAKSDRPGLHHSSWTVDSIDEVGLGSEQMRTHGYADGWGVGRHVLGSNYFYYVRDPWKTWAEYSFDIDFIPAGADWQAGDHPAEDSIYVWGPSMHPEFIVNPEAD
jgi:catechol 2,3-dioxygenase-like lactoylglutathione lyase family enzyme